MAKRAGYTASSRTAPARPRTPPSPTWRWRDQRRADQDRLALPHRPRRQVQPAAAHRGRPGRHGHVRRDARPSTTCADGRTGHAIDTSGTAAGPGPAGRLRGLSGGALPRPVGMARAPSTAPTTPRSARWVTRACASPPGPCHRPDRRRARQCQRDGLGAAAARWHDPGRVQDRRRAIRPRPVAARAGRLQRAHGALRPCRSPRRPPCAGAR